MVTVTSGTEVDALFDKYIREHPQGIDRETPIGRLYARYTLGLDLPSRKDLSTIMGYSQNPTQSPLDKKL